MCPVSFLSRPLIFPLHSLATSSTLPLHAPGSTRRQPSSRRHWSWRWRLSGVYSARSSRASAPHRRWTSRWWPSSTARSSRNPGSGPHNH
ncbi:hypothetical protein C8R46DRAFT_1135150 [Mycena filopes]|nr:hypothetical protein C8R46DRAFT_1135150 [Mycena filopes]